MSVEQSDIGFLVCEIIVCWYEILCVFVLNSSVFKTKYNYKKRILRGDLCLFGNKAINGNLKVQ